LDLASAPVATVQRIIFDEAWATVIDRAENVTRNPSFGVGIGDLKARTESACEFLGSRAREKFEEAQRPYIDALNHRRRILGKLLSYPATIGLACLTLIFWLLPFFVVSHFVGQLHGSLKVGATAGALLALMLAVSWVLLHRYLRTTRDAITMAWVPIWLVAAWLGLFSVGRQLQVWPSVSSSNARLLIATLFVAILSFWLGVLILEELEYLSEHARSSVAPPSNERLLEAYQIWRDEHASRVGSVLNSMIRDAETCRSEYPVALMEPSPGGLNSIIGLLKDRWSSGPLRNRLRRILRWLLMILSLPLVEGGITAALTIGLLACVPWVRLWESDNTFERLLAGLVASVFMAPMLLWVRYALFVRSTLRHSVRRLDAMNFKRDDCRGYALYVRSFTSDKETRRLQFGFLERRVPHDRYTEEEMLCMVMRRMFGNVVALGSPNERLPTVGAIRTYAKDGEWRQVVESLISKATIVMIHLSEGKYTRWELERTAELLSHHRHRILLLLTSRELSDDCIAHAQSCFPEALDLSWYIQLHRDVAKDWPAAAPYGISLPKEYTGVIWFDVEGQAHSTMSEFYKPNELLQEQDLVRMLGLHEFFKYHNLPSFASIALGFGICNLTQLDKPHILERCCIRPDSDCLAVRRLEMSTASCCPACIATRQRQLR
jgi:hypothetical protein